MMGQSQNTPQNDEEGQKCPSCNIDFSSFIMKHQCQKCLLIFCEDCCMEIPQAGERVCSGCKTEFNEIIKTVRDVVEKRWDILSSTCPKDFFDLTHQYHFKNVRSVPDKLWKVKILCAYFMRDLVISATRCWEAFRRTESDTPLFPDISHIQVYIMIQQDASRVHTLMSIISDMSMTPIDTSSELVQAAYAQLRENSGILKVIEPSVSVEELEKFLNEIRIYSFTGGGNLYGLSSFDGSIVYIWEALLRTNDDARLTLEHEVSHSLPRWKSKIENTLDPMLISPLKNENLRSKNGRMIEAGDYYEQQVYGKIASESPFCLYVSPFRGY